MKRLHRIGRMACAVVLLAAAAGASAQGRPPLSAVADQQRALRADLEDGGLPGLTPRQNAAVARAQADVFAAIDGKTDWDQLDIAQTIKVENALERINALVVNTRAAEARRDTCWREKKLGSSVGITRCGTEQERDEAREGARGWMERPKVCVPPGCGAAP